MNQLHIYAQLWQHSDAHIIGDRESLQQLRDQIDRALAEPGSKDACLNAFVNDGEGFTLYVMCLPGKDMDRLAVPYTDEMAQSRRGVHPHYLFLPQGIAGAPSATAAPHTDDMAQPHGGINGGHHALEPWDDPLQ